MPRDPDGSLQPLPDPRLGRWFGLANDGGPEADPTRGINCTSTRASLAIPRSCRAWSVSACVQPLEMFALCCGRRSGPRRRDPSEE